MGKPSRDKGKVGEREAAAELRRMGFTDARRGVQYQGGPDSPDVVGIPFVHIEVKRTEQLSLYTALAQAQTEADPGDVPLLLHRRNGKRWLAIVELDLLPVLSTAVVRELSRYLPEK